MAPVTQHYAEACVAGTGEIEADTYALDPASAVDLAWELVKN